MSAILPYKALALQTHCTAVNQLDATAAAVQRLAAIDRISSQVKSAKAFIGSDCRLVVLPEYFLTGFPMGETMSEWQQKGCVRQDGPEYKALGRCAADAGVFLCGNVYELDAHFPDLYFQTSFIIDPSGKLILRYRRLNSMFAATPHDVLDRYIELYGREALFPVVKTEIGNLACVASEEILYPEICRCLAFNGAEVILHNTSEVGSPLLTQKNIAKQARAIENMAYVVSANSAGIGGTAIPAASTDSGSKIVQYEGLVLCEAGYGESMVANATIDIAALRHHRYRPGMSNFLSRQRNELFAAQYAQTVYPANTLAAAAASRQHFVQTQQTVITQLKQKGIIE